MRASNTSLGPPGSQSALLRLKALEGRRLRAGRCARNTLRIIELDRDTMFFLFARSYLPLLNKLKFHRS
jgi:hypothetical protein